MKSNIFFKTSSGYVDYIRRDGFTINLVNPAFSEDNFKSWSYPYEEYMTDEFKREFQDYSILNKVKYKKRESGQINIEGKVYDGVLEIISTDRNVVKKQIDFGYQKLDFADFKINELNYGEINVSDIYNYANSVLDKTFPEINHCFPRVQTNEFERDENGNKINNCPIINDVYEEDDLFAQVNGFNRLIKPFDYYEYKEITNIIKPYVYLLEIFNKSFEYLGYNLDGDILNDKDFRFICLDNNGITYKEFDFNDQKEKLFLDEPLNNKVNKKFKFKTIGGCRIDIIYNPFYFNTVGNDDGSTVDNYFFTADLKVKVSYSSEYLAPENNNFIVNYSSGDIVNNDPDYISSSIFFVDIPFIGRFIEITVEIEYEVKIDQPTYKDYINININTIKQIGFAGNLEKGDKLYIMKNNFILKEFVPDIYFSDLIKLIKQYGYILIPKGKTIFVNKIKTNNRIVKDFSKFEVKYPEINFQKSDAKIIKLSSYEKLKYGKVTITKDGILLNSDKEFLNKEEIIINALPLPKTIVEKKVRNYIFEGFNKYIQIKTKQVEVIKQEEDSGTDIRLIKYRGIFNEKNDGMSLAHFLPENCYLTTFKDKIKYFHGENIKWSFISSSEEFKNLSENDKIFAYKTELEIISLTKTFIGENMYQIDFDTISTL